MLRTLRQRKLFQDVTSSAIDSCGGSGVAAYCGYDPTAPGLHVGNLVTLRALRELQQHHGIKPIALVGGATGKIGDPSGRKSDRELLNDEDLYRNVCGLQRDIEKILDFSGSNAATLVNNLKFYDQFDVLRFMREVGSQFRLSSMLAKDSVRSRLESDSGISFLEFSYQLFQSYDFYQLLQQHNCRIQVGGSDQWGNITSGIDFIKRLRPEAEAFGVTVPLLTTESGEKLGKSAGNAVWLDESLTSHHHFYQYFINRSDADVEKLLYCISDVAIPEVEEALHEHKKNPDAKLGQLLLAESITRMVRGSKGLESAQKCASVLFEGRDEAFSSDLIDALAAAGVPLVVLSEPHSSLMAAFKASGLVTSNNEFRRMAASKGLYVNGAPLEDGNQRVADAMGSRATALLLRKGKKAHAIVTLQGDKQ